MQDFGVRGPRRVIGLLAALGAVLALIVALAFATSNLAFLLTTQGGIGEIVAVDPVLGEDGAPVEGHYRLEVEFPDRNGQFRRFNEEIGEVETPEAGDEIAVRYRPHPPVDARIDQPWWIWRSATIAGGVALGLGVVTEELLRNRRRLSLTAQR
jgi:hypothetical protein